MLLPWSHSNPQQPTKLQDVDCKSTDIQTSLQLANFAAVLPHNFCGAKAGYFKEFTIFFAEFYHTRLKWNDALLYAGSRRIKDNLKYLSKLTSSLLKLAVARKQAAVGISHLI